MDNKMIIAGGPKPVIHGSVLGPVPAPRDEHDRCTLGGQYRGLADALRLVSALIAASTSLEDRERLYPVDQLIRARFGAVQTALDAYDETYQRQASA